MVINNDIFCYFLQSLDKHVEYSCKTSKLVENICKNRCKTLLPCKYHQAFENISRKFLDYLS